MNKTIHYQMLCDNGKPLVVTHNIPADSTAKVSRTDVMNYAAKMAKLHSK